MSSHRRILASRANGALSKGPATAAGKLRSSRNAERHGLLSRCLVLDDESPEAFQSLLNKYIDRLQPADELEITVVEEMVASAWRLRRAWAIETHLLDTASVEADTDSDPDPLGRITTAFKSLAAAPVLPLMHRYETRLHTMYQRALHNLLLLRAAMPNPLVMISEDPEETR